MGKGEASEVDLPDLSSGDGVSGVVDGVAAPRDRWGHDGSGEAEAPWPAGGGGLLTFGTPDFIRSSTIEMLATVIDVTPDDADEPQVAVILSTTEGVPVAFLDPASQDERVQLAIELIRLSTDLTQE